jgi:hypothetical protein
MVYGDLASLYRIHFLHGSTFMMDSVTSIDATVTRMMFGRGDLQHNV